MPSFTRRDSLFFQLYSKRRIPVFLLAAAIIPATETWGQNYEPYQFTAFAGAALAGVLSADGTGSASRFNNPYGVTVDSSGQIYLADSGKADIFLTNTTSGDRVIWLMNGSTIVTNAFMGTIPVEWTVGGTGDFNGDGKKDLFWTNTANGDRALWLLNGSTVIGGGYMGTVPVEWKINQ